LWRWSPSRWWYDCFYSQANLDPGEEFASWGSLSDEGMVFMASSNIVNLTEANFAQEVTQSPTPVLVDFWAEWCGPCKMIAPILDEIASEYDGKLKIGKVNIDEEQSLAAQHGIRAVPTLLIFKDGEVAEQIIGLKSKRDLKANLDKVVG
jgi:thioredoxin 1